MKLNMYSVKSNGLEYRFLADSAPAAMRKMLYTITMGKPDGGAKISLNAAGVTMRHNGTVYRCN